MDKGQSVVTARQRRGAVSLLLAMVLGAVVYAAMQFVLDRGRSTELASAILNRRVKQAA